MTVWNSLRAHALSASLPRAHIKRTLSRALNNRVVRTIITDSYGDLSLLINLISPSFVG